MECNVTENADFVFVSLRKFPLLLFTHRKEHGGNNLSVLQRLTLLGREKSVLSYVDK